MFLESRVVLMQVHGYGIDGGWVKFLRREPLAHSPL
jgi:hypothetical protein